MRLALAIVVLFLLVLLYKSHLHGSGGNGVLEEGRVFREDPKTVFSAAATVPPTSSPVSTENPLDTEPSINFTRPSPKSKHTPQDPIQVQCPSWTSESINKFKKECGFWYNQLELWKASVTTESPEMTYRCKDSNSCGGWGDRVTGMVSLFYRAMLTHAKMRVATKEPLHTLFDPCLLNTSETKWTTSQPESSQSCSRPRGSCDAWNNETGCDGGYDVDALRFLCFPHGELVCESLKRTHAEYSMVNLVGCGLQMILEPSHLFRHEIKFPIQDGLGPVEHLTLNEIETRMSQYFVISIQFRYGDYAAFRNPKSIDENDQRFYLPFRCAETLESYVKYSLNISKPVRWLVTSDSQDYKRFAAKYFAHKLLEFKFRSAHLVERIQETEHEHVPVEDTLAIWYLLGLGDELVTNKYTDQGRYDESDNLFPITTGRISAFAKTSRVLHMRNDFINAANCQRTIIQMTGNWRTLRLPSCQVTKQLQHQASQTHLDPIRSSRKAFPAYWVQDGAVKKSPPTILDRQPVASAPKTADPRRLQETCPAWSASFAAKFAHECGFWYNKIQMWDPKQTTISVTYDCQEGTNCPEWGKRAIGVFSAFSLASEVGGVLKVGGPSLFEPCLLSNQTVSWGAQGSSREASCFLSKSCSNWNATEPCSSLKAHALGKLCLSNPSSMCNEVQTQYMKSFTMVDVVGCGLKALFEPSELLYRGIRFRLLDGLNPAEALSLDEIERRLDLYHVISIDIRWNMQSFNLSQLGEQDYFPFRCAETLESHVLAQNASSKPIRWFLSTDSLQYGAFVSSLFKNKVIRLDFGAQLDEETRLRYTVAQWYLLGRADDMLANRIPRTNRRFDQSKPKYFSSHSKTARILHLHDNIIDAHTCERKPIRFDGEWQVHSKVCEQSRGLGLHYQSQDHIQGPLSFPTNWLQKGRIVNKFTADKYGD